MKDTSKSNTPTVMKRSPPRHRDLQKERARVAAELGLRIRCQTCDGTGWVCEDHPDRPWGGISERADACACADGTSCGCGSRDEGRALKAGFCIWFVDSGGHATRED